MDGDATGTDSDNDGVDASVDCNDGDENIGAASLAYYPDTDNDTFGDPDSAMMFCTESDAITLDT